MNWRLQEQTKKSEVRGMVVCGIDASSNYTGIAIFEDGKYIEHTLIDLHKNKNSMERIPQMMVGICEYLDKHKIDKIIMEESLMTSNVAAVKMLSNIAGAVMYYAVMHNIEFQFPLKLSEAYQQSSIVCLPYHILIIRFYLL
jgi:Holliday junction resolvasome RuvABC endonuclease subunit